jgi:hypothetical protein
MEGIEGRVGCLPIYPAAGERQVLSEEQVREILGRLERGEGVKTIARALGVDRKTVVKGWGARLTPRTALMAPPRGGC